MQWLRLAPTCLCRPSIPKQFIQARRKAPMNRAARPYCAPCSRRTMWAACKEKEASEQIQ